jgi:uncharacterized protein Yka (UPF0111/DUF47 family)
MFSLQKFFSKDSSFYDLLESSAAEAQKAAEFLAKVILNPQDNSAMENLRAARLKNKAIFEEISEKVVKTFVTALDKEDIEALSASLYSIPKPMLKVAERHLMAIPIIPDVSLEKQIALVVKASTIVHSMVKALRGGLDLSKIQDLNSSLHDTEEEADVLELELLKDLYNSPRNGLKVIIIKDLYHLLEKAIDRCRDAGNVVAHIFLKNS